MERRVKELLGFYLIAGMNQANYSLWTASCFMQGLHPKTMETLTYQETFADDTVGPVKVADLGVMKTAMTSSLNIVELESHIKVGEFLKRYPDQDEIDESLLLFSSNRAEVDKDGAELRVHEPNARTASALSSSEAMLKPSGELLSLYEEQVEAVVDTQVHLTKEWKPVNILQDLINAAALELRNVCSYRGEELLFVRPSLVNDTDQVGGIKKMVSARIKIFDRSLSNAPDTAEVRAFVSARDYIEEEMKDLTTLKDLASLGMHIDILVPQLPLVRRWWNYGV